MLSYCLTKKQYGSLEGLSYWISNKYHILERYDCDTDIEIRNELENINKTIRFCFNELDSLQVPFWVQNIVIGWSEKWRNTRREYLYQALEKCNVLREESSVIS